MSDVRVKTGGTFSALYQAIEGARGRGNVKGGKVLYLKNKNTTDESATVSATKFWVRQSGGEASALIFDAIKEEYGDETAKSVFKQVIGQRDPNHLKVSLDQLHALKNVLRYRRKLLLHRGSGIKSMTFSSIWRQAVNFEEERQRDGKEEFKRSKHLRFTAKNGIYFHTKLSFGFMNLFRLQTSRQDKRAAAGAMIWKSIAEEHGESTADTVFRKVFGNNAVDTSRDHKIAITLGQLETIKNEVDSHKIDIGDSSKELLYDAKKPLDTIERTQKESPLKAIDHGSNKIKSNNDNNNDKEIAVKNIPAIQNLRAAKIANALNGLGFKILEKEQEPKNLASVSDKDWKELFALPDDMPDAFKTSEALKKTKIGARMRQAAVMVVAKYGLQAARCARQEMIDKVKDDLHKGNDLRMTSSFIEKKYIKRQKISKARDPKIQYHPLPFSKEEMEKDFATKNGNRYVERKPHYFHLFTNPESKFSFPDSEFKKPLSALDQRSVLKITTHGSSRHKDMVFLTRNSDEVEKQRKNGTCLTAADLAKQLKEDGLPLDHKVIRLNTCLAGGDFQELWEPPPSDDKPNKPEPNKSQGFGSFLADGYVKERLSNRESGKIFGQELAMELSKLGYKNIVVGAYPGEVAEPSADDIREDRLTSKALIIDNVLGKTKVGLTVGLCRYFNGEGIRVENPRNTDKRIDYTEELRITEELFQDFKRRDDGNG